MGEQRARQRAFASPRAFSSSPPLITRAGAGKAKAREQGLRSKVDFFGWFTARQAIEPPYGHKRLVGEVLFTPSAMRLC